MDNSQEAEIQRRIMKRCQERYGKPIFNLFPVKQVITVKPIPVEEKKDDV